MGAAWAACFPESSGSCPGLRLRAVCLCVCPFACAWVLTQVCGFHLQRPCPNRIFFSFSSVAVGHGCKCSRWACSSPDTFSDVRYCPHSRVLCEMRLLTQGLFCCLLGCEGLGLRADGSAGLRARSLPVSPSPPSPQREEVKLLPSLL